MFGVEPASVQAFQPDEVKYRTLEQTARVGRDTIVFKASGRCILEEAVGFEPTVPCGTPDFESGTFGHSATLPILDWPPL